MPKKHQKKKLPNNFESFFTKGLSQEGPFFCGQKSFKIRATLTKDLTMTIATTPAMTLPNSRTAAPLTLSTWLFIVAGFVMAMVVLGGFTRLTGSGLSMVDWRPITGFLPPLNLEQWQGVFDLYKTSPEFQKVNFAMTVEDFKGIFWLEYIHRLVGRVIGLVFLIPLALTFLKKELSPWRVKVFGIFILGGLQGVMGWYMVKSGLVDDPAVSPFRLCAHLLLAFLTAALLFWSGLSLRYGSNGRAFSTPSTLLQLTLIVLTICYGAFVAGLKAGLVYNTFPLMGAGFIPEELLFHSPWYENFFTNPVTVQFTHRVLATLTLIVIWHHGLRRLKKSPSPQERTWIMALLGWSVVQVTLGIATLLLMVPHDLAVMHQAGALILLGLFLGSERVNACHAETLA